jgi:phosphatidylserine synthase
MQSLMIKFLGIPVALILANFLFKSVDFKLVQPIIWITAVLAPIGVLMEYIMISRISYGKQLMIDFASTFILVYLLALILPAVTITIWGSLLVALLITGIEAMVHKHLISDHLDHSYR